MISTSVGYCQEIVEIGKGSYLNSVPKAVKTPPAKIYKAASYGRPVPTNDWWSSVAWEQFSSPMFPHPLMIAAQKEGLRVGYPGANMVANEHAIIGGGATDFVIGSKKLGTFREALLKNDSDWFVTLSFEAEKGSLETTVGHGSPFIFIESKSHDLALTFSEKPVVWEKSDQKGMVGLTVANRHYGLFAESGVKWTGLDSTSWGVDLGKSSHLTIALLPSPTQEVIQVFEDYAYNRIVDSRVSWNVDRASGKVTTRFEVRTERFGSNADEESKGATGEKRTGTIFSLYPHQWSNTKEKFLEGEYQSVRGPMKLVAGDQFSTEMMYRGVLPTLPIVSSVDRVRLRDLLQQDLDESKSDAKDTYWLGKQLGKWATMLPLAEQIAEPEIEGKLRSKIKAELENYLTYSASSTGQVDEKFFYYDRNWGTLIGYPASYGSDDQLNDHHFHYGYFLRAAGEIVRTEPEWGADPKWGPMLRLLVRDIASLDREDAMFPFLRCFDPYAGHSWASGHAIFGDGNNNESSSEAVNAWYGLILLGEGLNDQELTDLGIWLYTTETNAIQHYWFDATEQFHHRDFPAAVVTMVWGGKGANATWFTDNPESVHGINWLPLTGASLYLADFPEYPGKNYQALLQENRAHDKKMGNANPRSDENWDAWADLIWMYRALSDSGDASRQFEAGLKTLRPEEGNSTAHCYVWIEAMKHFGKVDRTISADTPYFAVFQSDKSKTYVVFNAADQSREVRFTDGESVLALPRQFTILKRP